MECLYYKHSENSIQKNILWKTYAVTVTGMCLDLYIELLTPSKLLFARKKFSEICQKCVLKCI